MRKLTKALIVASLGVILVWGVSIAQNKPQRPDQSKGTNPGGPDGMMDNPKVQEELKRHGEVMKGLFEQIKTLHEKIRKELESKIGEPGNSGEIDPKDINRPGQQQLDIPPEGQGPEGQPNEEIIKILEPYRAEAQQIADKIASELVTHHQNLLKIVTSEKENIKNTLTEKILLPPPPRQGKQGKPDNTK